jgi:hypothetical protein
MTLNVPGPACWVVEGFWTKPEHVFDAMTAGHERRAIPDEWRDWVVVERYSWPKTLRQALHTAELVRRDELRGRGNDPVPLRLRNTDTGEIREIEWHGRLRLIARWRERDEPGSAIMPHKARLRERKV